MTPRGAPTSTRPAPASGRTSTRASGASARIALERILAAGARDGSLTADRDAQDVLALLAGLWTLPGGPDWPEHAERLARFVVDGLATR